MIIDCIRYRDFSATPFEVRVEERTRKRRCAEI